MNASQYSRIPNAAILASAGSGKTYALTTRYIRLLHTFDQPGRILALTFTRAAAGEFFEKIVRRLLGAATDPGKAAALGREIEAPELDAERYRTLLVHLLRELDHLNLQTLDSFFFRWVGAFPLELGLPPDLRLLDAVASRREQESILGDLLRREAWSEEAFNGFVHAYRQASFGDGAKLMGDRLGSYIDDLLPLYQSCPDAGKWGDPATIWGDAFPWGGPEHSFADLADRLLNGLPEELGKSQRGPLEKFAEILRGYPAKRSLSSSVALDRLLPVWRDLARGSATIVLGRGKNSEVTICGEFAEAAWEGIRALVADQLKLRFESTRGTHAILEMYQEAYDRINIAEGKLGFGDVMRVLGENSPAGAEPEARLLMEFRLDSSYRHWLFDEFQDTSRSQWEAVSNLIDETLADFSGERSFFYVGDTKQCLYLWRQSDDRLFHEILQRYGTYRVDESPPNESAILLTGLSHSWRSSAPVLETVNRIFSDPERIARHFSPATAARWERSWADHAPAPPVAGLCGGVFALSEHAAEVDPAENTILELLRGLDPVRRGLSCSILVRSNKDALDLAGFLRENGGPPVSTSSALRPLLDNAAGIIVRALLRLAAHPGDRFAKGYLKLVSLEEHSGPSFDPENLARDLRREFSASGFSRCVELAIDGLRKTLGPFTQMLEGRLNLLLEAASGAEGAAVETLDQGIHFLETLERPADSASGNVVIETIHRAKGLEYDVVIYYDSELSALDGRTPGTLVARDETGEPQWVLKTPPKIILENDPVLSEVWQENVHQAEFEALCRLYVALTRARRGLYLVRKPGRVSDSSLSAYLEECLGGEPSTLELAPGFQAEVSYQCGQPDWWQSSGATGDESPPAAERLPTESPTTLIRSAHQRLRDLRPSDLAGQDEGAGFDLARLRGGESTLDFGTAVHAAFEAVESWPSDTAEQEKIAHQVRETYGQEVADTFYNCLGDPSIRECFQASAETSVLREAPFTFIRGKSLVRGVFDRVHLLMDSDKQITRAEIIDFKTDRIESANDLDRATAHHRPQLMLYREALSAIYNIPKEAVRCNLIFCQLPRRVEVHEK